MLGIFSDQSISSFKPFITPLDFFLINIFTIKFEFYSFYNQFNRNRVRSSFDARSLINVACMHVDDLRIKFVQLIVRFLLQAKLSSLSVVRLSVSSTKTLRIYRRKFELSEKKKKRENIIDIGNITDMQIISVAGLYNKEIIIINNSSKNIYFWITNQFIRI